MSDFFDSLKSFSSTAADWIIPTTERRGETLGLDNLRTSAGETYDRSALAGLVSMPDLLDDDEMSFGKKLLWGTLMVGGAALTARELRAMRVAERRAAMPGNPVISAKTPFSEALGLRERFRASRPGAAERWVANPGLRARTLDVLDSDTEEALFRSLTDLQDPGDVAAGVGFIRSYQAGMTDMAPEHRFAAAQLDLAKFDTAMAGGVVSSSSNERVVALWKKLTDTPTTLAIDEVEELGGYVRQLGDATRRLYDETLQLDALTSIASIDFQGDGRLFLLLSAPIDFNEAGARVSKIRNRRIKQLNMRSLSEQAVRNMTFLYDIGIKDTARYLGDRGEDWYLREHRNLLAELAKSKTTHPWLDLDRLAAAVSLTSEATEWEENIALGIRVLDELADTAHTNRYGDNVLAWRRAKWEALPKESRPDFDGFLKDGPTSAEDLADFKKHFNIDVRSPEFQAWLRTGEAPEGLAASYESMLDRLHDKLTNKSQKQTYDTLKEVKKAEWKLIPPAERPPFDEFFPDASPGNFLSRADLAKTLRLFEETGQQVIATIEGPKQKNFYWNLYDPTDPVPVTVDRHQFDIFLGVASHSDFKGLDGVSIDDKVYDVIADACRAAARVLSKKYNTEILPHQVQGVVWQVWRVMKEEWGSRSHDWTTPRGPLRLRPDDQENLVYDILRGRPRPEVADPFTVHPKSVIVGFSTEGSAVRISTEGGASAVAPLDNESAWRLRHLRPAVELGDGQHVWTVGVPQRVARIGNVESELESQGLAGHTVEEIRAGGFGATHPAMWHGVTLLVDLPDELGRPFELPPSVANVIDPGTRVRVSTPKVQPPAGLREVSLSEFVQARRRLETAPVGKGAETTVDQMLSPVPADVRSSWKGHRFWLNADGSAGFALSAEGDLQQMFNTSAARGYGQQMVQFARANGARTLDFYDGEMTPTGGSTRFARAVSDAQLDAAISGVDLSTPDSGFTLSTDLSPVSSGYAVAVAGSDMLIPAAEAFADGVPTPALRRLMQDRLRTAKDARIPSGATEVGIGGWHNPKDGMVEVNLTVVFDEASEDAARSFAVANDQMSMARLHDPFEIIDTGGTGGERAALAADDIVNDETEKSFLNRFYSRAGFREVGRVAWDPEYDAPLHRATGPDVVFMEADPPMESMASRSSRSVRRVAVQPKPDQAGDIAGMVERIRAAGGTVRVVYSSSSPGSGWVAARDHLFDDGIGTMTVRTLDSELVSPHGFSSWIPQEDAAVMPKSNPLGQRTTSGRVVESGPDFEGGTIDLGGVAQAATPGLLKKKSGRLLVEFPDGQTGYAGLPFIRDVSSDPVPSATDMMVASAKTKNQSNSQLVRIEDGRYVVAGLEGDVTNMVRTVDLLLRLGIKQSDIDMRIGDRAATMAFTTPSAAKKSQLVRGVWNDEVPDVVPTGPYRSDLLSKYGIEFDPYHRSDSGELLTIPDEIAAAFDGPVLGVLFSDPQRAQMLQSIGFSRIGSASHPSYPAWTTLRSSGEIKVVLNAKMWTSPEEVTRLVSASQASGHWVPGLPESPAAILMHELGHVLFAALESSFRTFGEFKSWKSEIIGSYKRSLGKKKAVAKLLSEYGTSNMDEFVAEALAEAIFSPSPRPVSLEVYRMVTDQFKANTAKLPRTRLPRPEAPSPSSAPPMPITEGIA